MTLGVWKCKLLASFPFAKDKVAISYSITAKRNSTTNCGSGCAVSFCFPQRPACSGILKPFPLEGCEKQPSQTADKVQGPGSFRSGALPCFKE